MASSYTSWKGSMSRSTRQGSHQEGEEDSDEGEPRLSIVDQDEEMAQDGLQQQVVPVGRVLHKSISMDTSRPRANTWSLDEDKKSASEAIESLLLLGQRPVLSPKFERSQSMSSSPTRRYSSGCEAMDVTNSSNHDEDANKGSASYYQRMRERNNEASKRCRLKRRLKAESMESQANLLSMSNRLLKQRITRLEKIGAAFKEGVRRIQNKDCNCLQMVASLKKISTESPDVAGISNASLIRNSRGYREQSGGGGGMGPGSFTSCTTSSEDETTMHVSGEETTTVSLPNRAELTITPVAAATNLVHPPQPAIKIEPPSDPPSLSADQSIPITVVQQLKKQQEEEKRLKQQQQHQIVKISATNNGGKTALDVINDTIINSLKSPTVTTAPASVMPPLVFTNTAPVSTPAPLNLVKLVPAASLTRQQPPSPLILPHSPSVVSTPSPKHLILLSSPAATPETHRKPSTSSSDCGDVVIKCEPEIQIVECDPPQTNLATPASPGISAETSTCVAVARGASPAAGCRGELLSLNKLNTYLDLATKRATRDSGSAAMERAIIKSRLKIPFWKADEAVSFICEGHRHEIVNATPMMHCSLCNKKRAKKQTSPQSLMMTITYRMSLENYTTTGNILPIGLLVCGSCKDKHLKGVDFSNSQIYQPETLSSSANNLEITIGSKITSSGQTSGISITPICPAVGSSTTEMKLQNGHVSPRALDKPPVTIPHQLGGQPVTNREGDNSSSENIFARIGKLNDALRAINPRYHPIGFSITSIESCSQSVLQDAVAATETAVSTLMSVIAPGQEAFLWEAIRPKLDAKLGGRGGGGDQRKDSPTAPTSSSSPIPNFKWTVTEGAEKKSD